jgi:hypothetical protein
MNRVLLAVGCWLAFASAASAQVYVRAPFVRVQTGPGVSVQAPFVDVFIPPAGPVLAPGPVYVVPPPSAYIPPAPAPAPRVELIAPVQAAPAVVAPVVPAALSHAQTLEQFAAGFKPRGGSFDVDLVNPVTRQPTRVHFTLPEGSPKRVIVNAQEVEFRYGLFHFVRIEFDRNGAQVVTKLGR